MAAIKHLLIINSSPDKIYSAITTKKGVANWWTQQTEIGNLVGEINVFDFGERYHNEMKIINLVHNKHVEWECLWGDKEWIGTKFIFEIEEKGDGSSVLKFAHADWREETDFFASCNYQWGHYMTSLKQYCETGIGTPHRKQ